MPSIFYILFIVAVNVIVFYLAKKRQKNSPPAQAGTQTIVRVKCPKCGEIITDQSSRFAYAYGTPFRVCPKCHKEYRDQRYYEIAIEGPALRQTNVFYEAGSFQKEMDASKNRLSSQEYALRLSDYLLSMGPALYTSAPRNLSTAQYEELLNSFRGYFSQKLRKFTDLLQQKIGAPFQEFHLSNSNEMFSHLTYEAKNASAVKQLVKEILNHYGIDHSPFTIQVVYEPQVNRHVSGSRGSFTRGVLSGGTIRVVIEPDYSEYDTVIAIALHESAHVFLALRGIQLENTEENEQLTDAAAIYLGGGEYILRGYFPSSSYRIGYLRKIECGIMQSETKKLRDSWTQRLNEERGKAAHLCSDVKKSISNLLNSIGRKREALHPANVIREASQATLLYQLWHESEEWIEKAAKFTRIADKTEKMDFEELCKRALDGGVFEKHLRSFNDLLTEWLEAEDYQSQLSASVLDTIHGIQPLVEGGNAFAILEMIKFWSLCPATQKDAEVYYQKLLREETADHLCALGICSRQGIHVQRDNELAVQYFTRAAGLGSKDAKALLENQ